jgi:hypothetical protein
MALLVRKIDKHALWAKDVARPFLEKDDSPADVLSDLRTKENRISVYLINDDRSNLTRVVRAIAAGRDKIEHTYFIVFDSRIVLEAGIEMLEVPGETGDKEVNPLHRDLVLTGRKLVDLAIGILRHGEEYDEILRERLMGLVEEGIQNGELPEDYRKKLAKK